METNFDFNIKYNEYIYNVNSTTKLILKRFSDSIAVLYFTNETGNKINIPDGLVVYKYDFKKIIQYDINEDYPLCWTDDYII